MADYGSPGNPGNVQQIFKEPAAGHESGLITAGLIRKYASAGDYSIFLCGPQAMYDYCSAQIDKLGLPPRRVRREVTGESRDPALQPDYPGASGESFTLKAVVRGETKNLTCAAGESLLSGTRARRHCRPLALPQRRVRLLPYKLLSLEVPGRREPF